MSDTDFPFLESREQCVARNKALLRRVRQAGLPWELYRDLTACTRHKVCGAGTRCTDACWLASGEYRLGILPEGHEFLNAQPGPLLAATVVHPRWEVAIGQLATIKMDAAAQWLYRRLRNMKIPGLVAIGAFEVSVNVDLKGNAVWAGHSHLMVAGASKPALKRGLALEERYRIQPYAKPVRVEKVDNLARQLAYALKRMAKKRVAYIDSQNRQNRRQIPPRKTEQLEFDAWLLKIPVGGRTFLYGCRRHGQKLLRV